MKIAIIEDEGMVAHRLERMVREIVGDCDVRIAASLEGARQLTQQSLDLLFLDLNLKGRDGFDLLEQCAAGTFATVVVSAHDDQALRAFEYGVADFIAKPWSEERLRKAIARVRGLRKGEPARTLVVRKARELRSLRVDHILYIRGADDYAELHTAGGEVHLHEKTLAELASLLPTSFLRVHRSFIVNAGRVRGWAAASLRLENGEIIPIGRVFREAVRRRFSEQ